MPPAAPAGPASAPAPPVHGFLNLYKPPGITSMDALRQVKRATRQRKKVGHAGTLDPLAEGVLPVCFGQATRLMEPVVAGWKRYRMTVRLGAASATYDAEGEIRPVGDPAGLTRPQIAAALTRFVGSIAQTPPMYSAVKVDGQRLYHLARAGRQVERAPRQVAVRAIAIDAIALPDLHLTVDCGRGTYLRSIAHDLGQELGCGGYVTHLTRLSCGNFRAADAITPDDLAEAARNDAWQQHLHPVDWALRDLPPLRLTRTAAWAISNGQPVPANPYDADPDNARPDSAGSDNTVPAPDDGAQRRAYTPDDAFLALVQYRAAGSQWQPVRVFQPGEPSPYAPPPR